MAFGDVENSLSAIRHLADQADAQQRAVSNARRAADLATDHYRAGIVSYLEVVDASREALQAERGNAQLAGQRQIAAVQLIKALAGEGARVIINGRSEKRVSQADASIRAGIPSAKLEALPLDLSTAQAAAETTRRFPSVDVLVNNLGIYEPKPFDRITDADGLAIIGTAGGASSKRTCAMMTGMFDGFSESSSSSSS